MQINYPPRHPLRRMFAGLVEQAFGVEVGVCDPALSEYLVYLLLEFTHVDRLHTLYDDDGHPLASMADVLRAVNAGKLSNIPLDAGEIHRQVGDFSLFWAGVFPEGLRKRHRSVNPDYSFDYIGRGKESYAIAATLLDEACDPPGSLLRRLSAEFELCAHGLGLVRQGWQKRQESTGEGELLY